MYEFTSDLEIGNQVIDQEHRFLFQILNEAQKELDGGYCPKEALMRMEEHLVSYALTHFKHEEDLMRSTHDPELPIQEKEHKHFTDFIFSRMKKIESEQDAYSDMKELIEFIAKWLYQHIINSDCLIGHIIRVNQDNMDELLSFSRQYHTGIESIDSEHKMLFDIIRRCYCKLYSKETISDIERYDSVMFIIDELTEYAETHFAHEEEYMESIHYKDLIPQKRAHNAFIEKLEDVSLNISEVSGTEYLEDILDYLIYWLSNHILKMDKLIPIQF